MDQILAWLDRPPAERPQLVMSWWHGADRAGHRFGPDHARTDAALRAQDDELARLLAGLDARALWETTTLVVVSDHGMVALGDVIDVEMLLADAGVEAEVVHGTAFAHVHLASDDEATRRAASEAIRAARLRVHAPTELPISLRYRVPGRTGDLVVLSDPPVALRPVRGLEEGWRRVASMLGNRTGGHGYDPSHPDMHAIFVAMGRGVPAGVRLGRVHATQVAPTVARLLGIDPPSRAEGEPIDALRVAPTPDATASAAPAAVPTP